MASKQKIVRIESWPRDPREGGGRRDDPCCVELASVASEYRDLVAEHCPKCQGYGQDCAIEHLRTLVEEDEVLHEANGQLLN